MSSSVNAFGYRRFDQRQMDLLGKYRFKACKAKYVGSPRTVIAYRLAMEYVSVTIWRPAHRQEVEVSTFQKVLVQPLNAEAVGNEMKRELKLAERFTEEFKAQERK